MAPFTRIILRAGAVLCAAAVFTSACGDTGPTPPTSLTVSGLTPNSGPTESAVQIRISGSGFRAGATVTLGDIPATNVVINSETQITAIAPPHAVANVDVIVRNPDGATARKSNGYAYVLVTIVSVDPVSAWPGMLVSLGGTGFLPGVAVTMGGVAAAVTTVTPSFIQVRVPAHDPGLADIVVTNPGGQSGNRPGGFTFDPPPSLTASPPTVAAGEPITVSWTNSHPGSFDWIAIFRPGDRNENYGTYYYTSSGTSGAQVFTAPTTPGQYEFRYFLNDGFTDVARSNLITVIGSAYLSDQTASSLPFGSRK